MTLRLLVVRLLVALVVTPAVAQETTGNLRGRVLDEEGKPVPWANVVVSGPSLQGNRGVIAHEDGRFLLLDLPVGVHTVKVFHISYQDVTVENVSISLGGTTSLAGIRLPERVHAMAEVVIRAERPLIDFTSTNLGANLAADDYESLPIERSYQNVTMLLPHANESYYRDGMNVAGSTGLENKYFIEGVDVTDPLQMKGGMRLPYNFIREVQVRTGAYDAEHRSSFGGNVNVITYSGGNEFEGKAFGYFVNNQFAGDSKHGAYEAREGDFTHYDAGFSAGGPIQEDRLWYFAAYNPTFVREDVEIPGQSFFEDRSTTHSFAGKLTWRANDRNDLVATVFGDPTTRRGVGAMWGNAGVIPTTFANPDPYLLDIETGGISTSLIGRHRLGDRVLLKSLFSLSSSTSKNRGDTDIQDPLFIDNRTGEWSGGAGTFIDVDNLVTTVGLTSTVPTGRHTLKAGVEYKDARAKFNAFGWDILYVNSDTNAFEATLDQTGTVHNRIPSVFAQDSWLVTDELRLNFGLRWDGQYFVGSDGKVAQKILDQWQPRAGFVYQPGRQGVHKIAGSFGRFYHELATYAVASNWNEESLGQFIVYPCDPRSDPDCEGTVVSSSAGEIADEVDLEGQHFDEFTLGYERMLFESSKVGVRGAYRVLRQGLEGGVINELTGEFAFGNPGRGALSAFSEMKREYSALELVFQHAPAGHTAFLASYVLSKTWGNYSGLFNSDGMWDAPNANGSWDYRDMLPNSTGLLPNDRTHTLKLAGSRRLGYGVTGGALLTWQSGTPICEMGATKFGLPIYNFVSQRGEVGRTPSIWDLNFRFQYDLQQGIGGYDGRLRPRLTLDFLHVASQREKVTVDQQHYFAMDDEGNPISENPNYLVPTAYQPPMAVRFGMEVEF